MAHSHIFNMCNNLCLIHFQIALGFFFLKLTLNVTETFLVLSKFYIRKIIFWIISFTEIEKLYNSEQKSCLKIKFRWQQGYLTHHLWSVSERKNQALSKYTFRKGVTKVKYE